MRLPLATDLKTRVGDTTKDARLKNAYVEVRGDQAIVRKRPCAQGGVSAGTGTAQGGYGTVIFYGDTPTVITDSTGTTWSNNAYYIIGDHVSIGFDDFWSPEEPNIGNDPENGDSHWSSVYVPPIDRYTPTGTSNTVTITATGVNEGNIFTGTTAWVTRNASNVIIDSGSTTQIQVSTPPNIVDITFNGYMYTAAEMAQNKASFAGYGLSFDYPVGYLYYKAYGSFHYVVVPVSGSAFGVPY